MRRLESQVIGSGSNLESHLQNLLLLPEVCWSRWSLTLWSWISSRRSTKKFLVTRFFLSKGRTWLDLLCKCMLKPPGWTDLRID